ncbi:MAG: hypothetical protein H6627_01255 [Calditrichae bacterium]|nr:hypothetical protein [Calditrichia bacterium]
MDTGKVFIQLYRLIHENLYFKYNKSVSKTYFNSFKQISADNTLDLRSVSLTFLNKIPSSKLTQNQWRIPQTRIYVDVIKSADFEIIVTSGINFLLTICSSTDTKIDFSVHSKNKNSVFQITPDAKIARLFTEDKNFNGSEYDYLINKIDEERSLNPLNQIHTTHLDILREIDQTWSGLEDIGPEGLILSEKISHSEARLLGLTELYLALGKTEHLKELFSDSDLNKNNSHLIKKYYEKSCRIVKTQIPDQNSEVLKILLNFDSASSKQRKTIQDIWTKISLPGRKFSLNNLFSTNPLELVSFLILVLKFDFWWKYQAFDYLKVVLEIVDEQLFKLLVLVKQIYSNSHIIYGNDNLQLTNLQSSCKDYKYRYHDFMVAKYSKHNKEYSHFKIFDISVIVDKNISALYSPNTRMIHLGNDYNHDFQSIVINYQDFEISIPLVWRDFVVHINKLRLKILFKKNRFQISIKGTKDIVELKINNKQVLFTDTQYYRIYIENFKTNPSQSITFYDSFGRSFPVDAWPEKSNQVFIKVSANNKYGLISEYVQYQKQGNVRNRLLECNNEIEPIDFQKPFQIRIPKSEILSFSPVHKNDFISELAFTPADLLQNQLIIYSDSLQSIISQKWFSLFGFYPKTEKTENLDRSYHKFSILIAAKNSTESIYKKYIDKLNRSGRKSIIFDSLEIFETWLKDNFS